MFDDAERFARLIWNPRDFDSKTGKLKGSAFARRDLVPDLDGEGNPRYISMDILRIISKASVDWRILGAKSDKERRVEANFLHFGCGGLRSLRLETGEAAFELLSVPLAEGEDGPESPANEAHVGVKSATADPGAEDLRELKITELRNLLLSLHQPMQHVSSYPDVFGEDA